MAGVGDRRIDSPFHRECIDPSLIDPDKGFGGKEPGIDLLKKQLVLCFGKKKQFPEVSLGLLLPSS